jgi:hypothetical protein
MSRAVPFRPSPLTPRQLHLLSTYVPERRVHPIVAAYVVGETRAVFVGTNGAKRVVRLEAAKELVCAVLARESARALWKILDWGQFVVWNPEFVYACRGPPPLLKGGSWEFTLEFEVYGPRREHGPFLVQRHRFLHLWEANHRYNDIQAFLSV